MSDGMGSFDGIRKANERAARLEQKHAEKRKASEAKQAERAQADAAKKVAAGGEQPYKRTIKMTSTASRKRARPEGEGESCRTQRAAGGRGATYARVAPATSLRPDAPSDQATALGAAC